MKKGFALAVMLLAAALMLSGCNLIGYDAELDGAQVVAKINDKEITKAEWLGYRDELIAYEQQYMQQYYGMTIPVDETMIASYSEAALEQLIESVVIEGKLGELGLDPLPEADAAEVESYADSMVSMYKMILRFQNYPEVETVEEEAKRLAEATPSEAEPAEPAATMTDAELDEKLTAELNEIGYTRDYFVKMQTMSVQQEKLREKTSEGVVVTDEQVKTEFDNQAAQQQTSFDETPTLYAAYVSNSMDTYYVPAGYRGVKHVLVKITEEKQAEIDALNNELTTAQNMLDNANKQLEEIAAEDTSALDAEGKKMLEEQVAELKEQAAQAQATIDETQPKLDAANEAAYAEILPRAEEVLAKAQAGEDFDALVETYGEDDGMTVEPNKSRGYLVCEGLALYDQAFQDGAMALANVGDVSAEPVKSSFGYHIMQYACDVEAGVVEFTDEVKTKIHDTMLTEAQDAAYEAAVAQWVAAAKVEKFPKVME